GIRRILAIDVPQMILLPEDAVALIEGSNSCSVTNISSAVQQTRGRRPTAYPRPALSSQFVAASNELERKIAAIWQRALGIDEIGTKDNFFDLGGNSLVGLQVVAELRKELDVDLRQVVLFEAPTINALVRYLSPATEEPAGQAAGRLLAERRERVRVGTAAREIALIGMSGRFPGARTPHELWENVSAGVESVTFYTEAELLEAGVSSAKLRNPNYVRAGYDVEGLDLFDARLFGYAPREAEVIDPQHRQFLECAWEALEDAACDPDTYRGLIGIFAGAAGSAYMRHVFAHPELLTSGMAMLQANIGNHNDSLATRVAYKLNLRGPAMSVQTFCSTSGTAMHAACKSLQYGECDIAMAGGVNIAVSGKAGYLYEEGGIDSPDGHTRTFDADAKGSVIGDGVGVVVFKRLEDALADGDHIYAVVKGSALNNDGSLKVGYTAPSIEGQAAVVAEALAVAGVAADSISFIETHGTATELGDPIEVAALTKAYRQSTDKVGFCALGSVKTNIGHLDRAAGVTGMIKAALSLQHERIAPVLHFKAPNPSIDFANSPFFVAVGEMSWPRGSVPRRAGVNVLGVGGTNVHFILEEAPELEPSAPSRGTQLLLLSAKTQASLDGLSARICAHLRAHPEQDLADVAYTLQTGRKRLEFRKAVACGNHGEAIAALEQDSGQGHLPPNAKPSVVFMFPGVGDHYQDMAVDLYRTEPVFRDELDYCCERLQPVIGLDLRELLFTQTGRAGTARPVLDLKALLKRGEQGPQADDALQQTWLAQPCVFVIEYCLANLLMSWGIVPQALIGYSLGEYVAATVAGSLALDDALRLVAMRAKLIESLPIGAMLAVSLPEDEVRGLLDDALSVAICNSPKMTVVSGPTVAIEALEARLSERQVMTRRLQTTHAFHSSMMEPACEGLRDLLSDVTLKAPQIPYLSNLTGTWIEEAQVTSPDYWLSHLCQPVRFADSIGELLKDKGRVLIEVGPGQNLGSFVKQHPGYDKDVAVISLLRAVFHDQADDAYLQTALTRLWLTGIEPDWAAYYANERRLKLSLPTYAFDQQSYWVERGKSNLLEEDDSASGKFADIGRWFYQAQWLPSPLRAQDTDTDALKQSTWLLLLDRGGVGTALATKLREKAPHVVTIASHEAATFSASATHDYVINAHDPSHLTRVLRELRQAGITPDHIVHLGNVDQSQDFDALQEHGFYSLLGLVRALDESRMTGPTQLLVVSKGLYAVRDEDVVSPGKGTSIGVCRTIPQECPNITLRSIDLDDAGIDRLYAEVIAATPDVAVAYRGDERLVQTYASQHADEVPPIHDVLRQAGTYVITGGLGNVGLTLAGMLTRRYAANVALVSRRGLPEREVWDTWLAEHAGDDETSRQIIQLRALGDAGGDVLVLAADIADEARMGEVFALLEARYGRIHGVFHAAGLNTVESHNIIKETTRQRCEAHFVAKVHGTQVLGKLLDSRQADFCLLFSSLSATLGGITLSMYAAANAYEDSFALSRRNNAGTRWVSVNWDSWARDGEQFHKGTTLEAFLMWPDEGAEAVRRVLGSTRANHLVNSTASL
ncbi:MAG TPA: SDR family NAD(P)-dependent oxidoreductase, partial [Rhodanobacter sp.]|nr:SDR family NAD(P)-dependent oxidoreductase [Rhodanobacter sp.]